MTLFDHRRLNNAVLKLDVAGLRRGDYSDRYFKNIVDILQAAHDRDYRFAGQRPRPIPGDPSLLAIGDLEVEAQVFNRRSPRTLIGGVDVALAMLRHATGYFAPSSNGGQFHETWGDLDVEAVEDGGIIDYEGDVKTVRPVIKIRGRYRDFALLETPILGVLTRTTRMATNVYETVVAAGGKQILFFPARFDIPEVQAIDGYAYWLAVQRYNHDTGARVIPSVSTDAQGAWWGGRGGGTIPHALIAAFLSDTAEAMVVFAETMPVNVPRIALVDFNNDAVGDSLSTLAAFWPRYRDALRAGDDEGMRRWTLNGVRLDTSYGIRDQSLGPDDPTGVNEVLVSKARAALDEAWTTWGVEDDEVEAARVYCRNVKIAVTGGFDRERIRKFEQDDVPVDIYGVGSTFLRNDPSTNTDFTMDVVRVKIDGQWIDMAKVGRAPADNPDLRPVDLAAL